jgi:hypothetical protein
MLSASILDFTVPCEKTVSPIGAFPMGKTKLPSTSAAGISRLAIGKSKFTFTVDEGKRHLVCHLDQFQDGKSFDADIWLTEEPEDSMVIATPFPNAPKAFYYNQKIVGMRASGTVKIGDSAYIFEPAESFGLLDWGRGVWTYSNTWYWGAGHGEVDGHVVGFNIGYGFGDNSAATENMLFYDGKAHKLSQVVFEIPKDAKGNDDFMSPWKFTSDDGRFEMDFVPVIDRASDTDFKILCSKQHQVFGHFTGKAVLDDGTELEIKDFFGFAEKVFNKW